ncbi:MAG: hypothetical protein COX19_16205 [Desulfobacterales bacterium CG23_combo_of_CG06-09_8_20_14_all_51_8]|nr:MAG: hypothetical protein COX19_16205 [Desulfobacterales bacterium CG23_combo_of_CG06-09_8_20_14_all_51_8]
MLRDGAEHPHPAKLLSTETATSPMARHIVMKNRDFKLSSFQLIFLRFVPAQNRNALLNLNQTECLFKLFNGLWKHHL